MTETITKTDPPVESYSPVARAFHWVTAALIAVQVPIGIIMVYRGNTLNIWDATTNNLYSTHKLVGFILLWLILARVAYRLWKGAPAPEPTLQSWQHHGSRVVHTSLYVLLIVMPILGWLGVSLYPALEIFGLFSLPALTAADQETAARVLAAHAILAWILIALIAGHVTMALYHHFVRGDNVLRRMLKELKQR
jgi:cytochrome b561